MSLWESMTPTSMVLYYIRGMPYTDATLSLLAPDGTLVNNDRNAVYHQSDRR